MFNLPKRAPKPGSIAKDALDAKRDRESARSRTKSAVSREIGPLPPIADKARRAAGAAHLKTFARTYFPNVFYLPFSPAHDRAVEKIERAVRHGGLFAFAMPRGQGKTTLAKVGATWAIVNALIKFVCLIGATKSHAEELLAFIKAALGTNALLIADYPEICLPIRALENDGRRCTGQIVDGKKTNIIWKDSRIVLPTVAGSAASGSIVSVCGITGRIRGQTHTLPDGGIARPELVIPDDPQTIESAWSDAQCQKRYRIMMGDVLGLAGPGKKIAAVLPGTVIRKGDMVDRLLDRQKSPDWQGERTRMLTTLPTNEKLWEEYGQLRVDSLRADGDGREATDFYRKNRAAMDAGAEAAWPERFDADEISAVQNAMNLKMRNEDAFWAEAQNEPREAKSDVIILTADQISQKLNGLPRGVPPIEAQKITAFIDVHDALLYWAIVAWSVEHLDGWVLDYGSFPEQPRRYYTLREAQPTLASTFAGLTKEATLRRGLESLCGLLLARQFTRTDGAAMGIDKLLIDQGYLTPEIHNFVRSSGRAATIMPAKGVGITAASKPISDYVAKPGELLGTNWIVPKPAHHEMRHVRHDANFFKTFVHNRLGSPAGTKGALTLYGTKSGEHRLLADHLVAEYPTPTEGHGRKLVEWRIKPGRPDNHLLDCLVGCAVGASLIGCGKSPGAAAPRVRRKSYRKPVYLN